MRRAVVTGAAGFIGSHLSEALLGEGYEVVGVDSLDPFYPVRYKLANLEPLILKQGFKWIRADLATDALEPMLEGADVVFHLAARAGVRSSWGADFQAYVASNILATQRLMEALRGFSGVRLVVASSSSVYGERSESRGGTDLRPISPYGVTKLASERLSLAYHSSFGIPVVALRYFTVFGPRQRPDMAFHKFLRSALEGRPIAVYGDGSQVRDFTYVGDAVRATILAATEGKPGSVYDIGGGSPASVAECIGTIERLLGRRLEVEHLGPQAGDPRRTRADTEPAARDLGFRAQVSLERGLEKMIEWMRALPEVLERAGDLEARLGMRAGGSGGDEGARG